MNNLEKKDYFNELYSYYSNLLTDKQREVFEEYYFNDYSLSEIAEESSVSRAAIFDTLSKVERLLENYEEKLQILAKNKAINLKLEELKEHSDECGKRIINDIIEME